MANKQKTGLQYFPMEVDMFNDMKTRKLIKRCGSDAVLVYMDLLCKIYKSGYYIKWDDDLAFTISEDIKLEESFIVQVIEVCLEFGLFSETIFKKHQVLTSSGIQKRYSLICKQLKRSSTVFEYSINSSEEIPKTSESIGINSEEMHISSESIPQSKVKENKVKERKENLNKESEEKIGEVFFRINDQIFLMPPSEYFKSNFPGFFEQWIMKNGNEISGPAFEKMDTEYFGYTFADINHIRRTFITCWNKCRNVKKSFQGKPPDNKMTAVLDAYQSSAKKLGL